MPQSAFHPVCYPSNTLPSFSSGFSQHFEHQNYQQMMLQDHSPPLRSFSAPVELRHRPPNHFQLFQLSNSGNLPSGYNSFSSTNTYPTNGNALGDPKTVPSLAPSQNITPGRISTTNSPIVFPMTQLPPGFTDFSISKLLGLDQHSPPAPATPAIVHLLGNSSLFSSPLELPLTVDCSSSPGTTSSRSDVSSCSCPTPPAILSRPGGPEAGSVVLSSQQHGEEGAHIGHTRVLSDITTMETESRKLTAPDGRNRKSRTVYEPEQVDALERLFQNCQYLMTADRMKLSTKLGLNEAQIKIWFQNRRSKHHRDSLKLSAGRNTAGRKPVDHRRR